MNIRLNSECREAVNRAERALEGETAENGTSIAAETMPLVTAALIVLADAAERDPIRIMSDLVSLRLEGRI